MRFVDFVGSNITLVKPEGWTDEECQSVHALKETDLNGHPFYMVAVVPNKEDLDALNAGRPLYIKVTAQHFAPMFVFTMNEEDKPNF